MKGRVLEKFKFKQGILIVGVCLLGFTSLSSLWLISALEREIVARRRATVIQDLVEDLDQTLKNWIIIRFSKPAHKVSLPNASLETLGRKTEQIYEQLEEAFSSDRAQLKKVILLREEWKKIQLDHEAQIDLKKIDEIINDMDLSQLSKVEEYSPAIEAKFKTVFWVGVTLLGASTFLVFYSIASLHREELRKEKVMAELVKAKEKAFEASALKSQFLATVSHEIRTPLNGIIGMADLLRRTTRDKSVSERIETIYESGRLLLRIINNILDFSKIEAKKVEINNAKFNLEKVVKQIVNTLQPKAREKALNLTCKIEEGVPEEIVSDPEVIGQILFNLVGNAIKFTKVGGVVIKVASLTPKSITFSVEDTGEGISVADQTRIFEPFYQARKPDGEVAEGTGLGLSIASSLVHSIGGELKLRSEINYGSRFFFSIPLKPSENMKTQSVIEQNLIEESTATSMIPVDLSGLTALVVEDNPTNQIVLMAQLEELGVNVLQAANGKEALEAVNDRIDIVLMDCQMPILNGYEATRQLLAKGFTAPIVAMTANISLDNRMKCTQAGMVGFLVKPVTVERLTEEILKFVNNDKLFKLKVEKLEGQLGREVRNNVLNSFLLSLVDLEQVLQKNSQTFNLEELQKAGHQYKASSSQVGLLKLARLCDQMENLKDPSQTMTIAREILGKIPCIKQTLQNALNS